MKPVTQEWIEKAERDWGSAQREASVLHDPNYDLACFAAQQCAEKYLKGRLVEAGVRFRKTHDLEEVLNLALAVEPTWNVLLPDLKFLSDFAVDYRYPGLSATHVDAQDAVESCRRVREAVRIAFGLPV